MAVIDFLKHTQAELHRIAWPTRRTTLILTTIVIAFSLFVAAYLGALDYIFTGLLQGLV
ncbi:MAG: preprotein translocase subunit SecE [Candidatus Paceibacterota bacterium]